MASPDFSDLVASGGSGIEDAIGDLIRVEAERWIEGADPRKVEAARAALAERMLARHARAMMAGARKVLDAAGPEGVRAKAEGRVPAVPPTHAIAALLAKDPRLATTVRRVGGLYADPSRFFTAARASEMAVLSKIQGAISEGMRQGKARTTVRDVVARLGRWSKDYADNVVQTTTATAYTDGVLAQAEDPDVREAVVGMEIVGPKDGDTRANHRKAVGWRAALDDPRWGWMRPPLGFRCRHSLNFITREYAERRGWLDRAGNLKRVEIPEGAGPDEGFRVR